MLPYDILESQIFYHLDGADIQNLALINKETYKRLFAIQIFRRLRIKSFWPELVILDGEGVDREDFKSLSEIPWIFPKMVVPSGLFCTIHEYLPSFVELKVFTTLDTNYHELSKIIYKCTELYCSKDITPQQIFLLSRTRNKWNLNHLHINTSGTLDDLKYLAVHELLRIPTIRKYQVSGGMSMGNLELIIYILQIGRSKDVGPRDDVSVYTGELANIISSPVIETLILSKNNIDSHGFFMLTHTLPYSGFKELQISFNDFSSADLCHFFDILPRTMLETFHYCGEVDISAQQSFISVLPKTKLKTVSLEVAPEFIDDFLFNCSQSALEEFHFTNAIGNLGVKEMRYLKDTNLTKLSMNYSGISDTETLMKFLAGSKVRVLELNENKIGLKGIAKIATMLYGTNLKSLALENCGISDRGVLKLASNLRRSKLDKLYLKNNSFTSYGLMNLLTQMKINHMSFLEANWIMSRSGNDAVVSELKATYPGHVILYKM
ncbi:hypothetical protein HDV06_006720 [Boothiomyces sp. JEL0866]|nr:hypothetical protein HDV06_006720 [Boothiomyces sp. JEL0866]